jgi:dTDP-4-dehydrorhamnose reductase
MKPKKFLILGATGLLGKEISAHYLAKAGTEVLTPNRQTVDITNKDSISSFIEAHKPDIVINCAAIKDVNVCEDNPYKAWEINVFGPGFLADAISQHSTDTKLIHISSADIFGGEKKTYIEPDIPQPISVYGQTKVASEKILESIAHKVGFRLYIIRTAWLYGLHKKSFIDSIVESLQLHDSVLVAEDQYDTPVWTYDFAQALDKIIDTENNTGGIYHCVPNVEIPHSRLQIAEYVADTMNLDKSLLKPVKRSQIFRAMRPASSILYNSNTEIFTMPDWKISLKKYLGIKYR